MAIYGLTFNEVASPTLVTNTSKINDIYLVGTSVSGDTNTPTEIADVSSFTSTFGVSPSLPDIALIKAIDSGARLFFVRGDHPASSADPDAKEHYLAGVDAIGDIAPVRPAILITPEGYRLSSQSDRTAIYTAAQALVSSREFNWLYFHNTGTATTTKAAALTERDIYSSSKGNSSLYFGYSNDFTTPTPLPSSLAVSAAAVFTKRSREEIGFQPNAGALYSLPIQSLTYSPANEADYEDLRDAGINTAINVPGYGYCLWGARTLAVEDRWKSINTRHAASIVLKRMEQALLPTLFTSNSSENKRRVIANGYNVLRNAYLEGALFGNSETEAFSIQELPTTTGSTRSVRILFKARFIDMIEEIEVTSVNVGDQSVDIDVVAA